MGGSENLNSGQKIFARLEIAITLNIANPLSF